MPDQIKYYHDAKSKCVRKVYPVLVKELFYRGRHSGWECSQSWQHMGAEFGYDKEKKMWDRHIEDNQFKRYMNEGDTRERALNFFGDARRLREGEAEISAEEYANLFTKYEELAIQHSEP